MNGIQFFLLAFCLTLVEVINSLLIGRTGMVFFCGFFSLCHIFFFNNLSLDYLFGGFSFANGINNLRLVIERTAASAPSSCRRYMPTVMTIT